MDNERKATWIWYPGDFEVWLGNKFNNRRTERGVMFPPFWKQDSHWPTVTFTTFLHLEREEPLHVLSEGHCSIAIDGRLTSAAGCAVPAGSHTLTLKVWNQLSPPAVFIDGLGIKTGPGWQVTCEDKIWIDEQGAAHGSGVYVAAAFWHFDSPSTPPSSFRLPTRPSPPALPSPLAPGLYDFGRETFGFLRFHGLRGEGALRVCYGESREEALDSDRCETLDTCTVSRDTCERAAGAPLFGSKAFRYVCIDCGGSADYDSLTVDEEYAPFDTDRSGAFSSSDDELNSIWQVSARTLELTTREFFTDGIKRDRWTWSGDAIQSYLMNYYLHFDTDCVKRTIRQLRGKDPVTTHVNTIMDYTFYWFISIADYYRYTADIDFLHEIYPRMATLMDFVLPRLDRRHLASAMPGDWVFVDWADFAMPKRGALCFEQLLLWKALGSMLSVTALLRRHPAMKGRLTQEEKAAMDADTERCGLLHRQLDSGIRKLYYSRERHAFLHAIDDEGRVDPLVTKFPNMFAILYDYADDDSTRQDLLRHVLLNPSVPAVTTPYMHFYELETLCRMGMQPKVLSEMKAYWGGMLREGATTFWEKYNPGEHGTQHLAMYGRPYGKSLCHSWGAAPLYIIGRYFLGVYPTQAGYEEYEVRPATAGLQWMEGDVPTPFGKIHVEAGDGTVAVVSDGGHGRLIAGGKSADITPGKKVEITL